MKIMDERVFLGDEVIRAIYSCSLSEAEYQTEIFIMFNL